MTITVDAPTDAQRIAEASKQFSIQVYTKPACPKCTATYRWFDNRDISYNTPIDVTEDHEAFAMLKELGIQAMPYVTVEGPGYKDSWNDLNMGKLEALHAAIKDAAGV